MVAAERRPVGRRVRLKRRTSPRLEGSQIWLPYRPLQFDKERLVEPQCPSGNPRHSGPILDATLSYAGRLSPQGSKPVNSRPPSNLGPATFDVSIKDREYRRQLGPLIWTLWAAGPILIGIVVWARYSLDLNGLFFDALTLFLLGLAGFALLGAARSTSPAVRQLHVKVDGLVFHYVAGTSKTVSWVGLTHPIKMVDWSSSGSTFSRFPCTMECRGETHGISLEAVTSIARAARESGLHVKDSREGPAGSQVQKWVISASS